MRVDELGRARPAYLCLAEMADVEDADRLAHRGVLLDDAAAGVLDGHLPATEVGELGAEGDVPFVQRGAAQSRSCARTLASPEVSCTRPCDVAHRPSSTSSATSEGSPVTTVTLSNAKAVRPEGRRTRRRRHQGPARASCWRRAPRTSTRRSRAGSPPRSTRSAARARRTRSPRSPSLGATSAPVVVAVGLGDTPDGGKNASPYDDEVIRRAVGTAVRALAGTKRVGLALPTGCRPRSGRCAEGALLGAYAYRAYRVASKPDHKDPVDSFVVVTAAARDRAAKKGARAGAHRRRGRAPGPRPGERRRPPTCHPPSSPTRRRPRRRRPGCRVEVLDEKALKKGGYGGILGVGQGSSRPPRLVKITYRAGRGQAAPRAGRQGHHVRLRRPVAQAAGRDGVDEVRHGRRGRDHRRDHRHRPARPRRQRDRVGADGREHAVRHGAAAVRRADDVRRQDRRGAQHRRRGPADPGRRDRAGRARTSPT